VRVILLEAFTTRNLLCAPLFIIVEGGIVLVCHVRSQFVVVSVLITFFEITGRFL
jgi:hypothetical protein